MRYSKRYHHLYNVVANDGSGEWMYTYKVNVIYDIVVGTESYIKLGSVCISSKCYFVWQNSMGKTCLNL